MDYFNMCPDKLQWPWSYRFTEPNATCTSVVLIAASGTFLNVFVKQLFASIYLFGFQNFLEQWAVQLNYVYLLCLDFKTASK